MTSMTKDSLSKQNKQKKSIFCDSEVIFMSRYFYAYSFRNYTVEILLWFRRLTWWICWCIFILCRAAGMAWMYNCWPYAWDVAPAVCVPKLKGGGVPEWNDCFSYDCSAFNDNRNDK